MQIKVGLSASLAYMLKVFISDSKTMENMVGLVLLWECELGITFLHKFWKYALDFIEHVCLVIAILHLGIFLLGISPKYMQYCLSKILQKLTKLSNNRILLTKYIAFSWLNIY